jgi:hypothetical protein
MKAFIILFAILMLSTAVSAELSANDNLLENVKSALQQRLLGENFVCIASTLLIFYAPIHTIIYCLYNASEGYMTCLEEIAISTLSAALLYGVSCSF